MMDFLRNTDAGILLVQFLVSFFGSATFALLFGVPKQFYASCGLVGGIGWLFYTLMVRVLEWMSPTVAALLATVIVVLLSRIMAVIHRCPATVFLISGIFPLVPGGGVYWTVFYLVMGDLAQSQTYGFTALKVALAIVVGIVLVTAIPEKLFHLLTGRTEKAPGKESK